MVSFSSFIVVSAVLQRAVCVDESRIGKGVEVILIWY